MFEETKAAVQEVPCTTGLYKRFQVVPDPETESTS